MHPDSRRRTFHTFDALRFLACLKVLLQHIPVLIFPWFNVLRAGGYIGVEFFFVLSGFLITYILYEERLRTGTVNLKHFFMRRILRIWPLYFLMVGVAYTVPLLMQRFGVNMGGSGYEPKLWMSLLFLENYRSIATGQIAGVSPLYVMWSLCVEEHFYIVWGLLAFALPLKRLPWLLGLCLVLGPVARWFFFRQHWLQYDLLTNIDLFAWGALPAWLLLRDGKALEEKIENIPLLLKQAYAVLLTGMVLLLAQASPAAVERVNIAAASLLGLLFAFLLLLALPARTRFQVREDHWLSRLGAYTYSLYLYHTLVIVLLVRLFAACGAPLDRPFAAVLFMIAAIVLSMLASMASYHWFEKPFLKLKKYFR